MVDFPEPVTPTKALNLFVSGSNEILLNILFCGFEG
jgi:hypothetical protein